MNRSMVVTEVCTICLLRSRGISDVVCHGAASGLERHPTAIGRDRHGSILISPPHRNAMRVESSQSFARRVAVVVVSDRYHGPLGSQGVEPFISGTAAAAVMTHLQEVDLTGQTSHRLFRGKP